MNHYHGIEGNLEDLFDKRCNYNFIYKKSNITQNERCEKIGKGYCRDHEDLINYYALYFCTFDENTLYLLIFSIICILINFRYLAIVIDDYCAEGITKITNWLGFSQALAAVTLLAFANGSGDVVTALVASEAQEGVFYNIGSLFGAGLFCCCMVVGGAILLNGKPIVFDKFIIYRDITFYIIAALATIGFGILGRLTWKSSVVLLIIYVSQVLVVVFEKQLFGSREDENGPYKELEEINVNDKNMNGGQEGHQHPSLGHEHNKSKGVLHYILMVIDFPFVIVGYFTLLPTDLEHYSRLRCLIWSYTGVYFMFFVIFHFDHWEFNSIVIAFLIGSLLFFIFFFALPMESEEKPEENSFMDKFMTTFGVISSLFWMYLLLESLIDLLNCIGMVFNLDPSFIGFTILAVGNALPDALNTFALSEMGKGIMAISGAYNGQLFGLLVGFGLGNLKMTLKHGPQEFKLFEKGEIKKRFLGIFVIFVVLFTLIFTWIYAFFSKFKMGKCFSFSMFGIYLFFFSGAIFYSFFGGQENIGLAWLTGEEVPNE